MNGDLAGKEVIYISTSGREYKATITNVWEKDVSPPLVSLEFRDDRNKLIRKYSVLHQSRLWNSSSKCWKEQ